ncbi:hypothetical protein IQ251_08310 [Saccharopolyspora sp. HNM0983]|uniref:DivIVA protein n=1 Tax=Saccharopolyspora montiporae TaxID=2781240 RepID=A0A929FXA0_9PSEU|nr:hypothetical protein [Saccharopolyspora sp. HNM0983]MBE9374451.1 hypothetical protein [Saccharopolyspora sp. HNM0983]
MEDAEAVVPLRPGFDIQVRGFNRNQVVEHIELLEDQLRLLTIDRDEAAQLNTDLRKLCDDTRHSLDETEARLKRIESSDTGLPAASQRVQNMLSMAEEEVQTLRDQARRQADIIRGSAETESRELIGEAERAAGELRTECSELVADVESRRNQLRREHEQNASDLRNREHQMRQTIRDEYKRITEQARTESDELITETRRQCAQMDAETEQRRLDALEEIRVKQAQLEELRDAVLSSMDRARQMLDDSASNLRAQHPDMMDPIGVETDIQQQALVPEPREQDTTAVSTPEQSSNGSGPQTGAAEQARQN